MCGRTCLTLNKEQVQCACSYKPKNGDLYEKPEWIPEYNEGKDFIPSYNIAPGDVTPVLVANSRFKITAPTDRVLKPMMWGVIPTWHKGDYKSHGLTTNNCRLENIKTSKLYGPILENGGRCVVIAEGFYEWQTTNKGAKVKQPYYIYSRQDEKTKIGNPATWTYSDKNGWTGVKLLYMAGLYNMWKDEGKNIYSYSIITMKSDTTLSWLHHRMPAILNNQEQINIWLDTHNVNADMALTYLRPVSILSWHPVSEAVNNSRNKSEECNKRVKAKAVQTCLTAWFKRTEERVSTEESASCSKKLKPN